MKEHKNDYVYQLPSGVLPEAIERIDKVAQETNCKDCESLATAVYKSLASEHRDGSLEDAMQSLGIGTSAELLTAVNAYIALKEENPDISFYEAPGEESFTSEDDSSEVSDIALFLIDNIVKKTKVTNRYDVMSHVCEILEHRFGDGEKLEQNLKKLHLKTTKQVLHAVDIYFIMKKLYPDTVFGRKRMYGVWASSFSACLSNGSDGAENSDDVPLKEAS